MKKRAAPKTKKTKKTTRKPKKRAPPKRKAAPRKPTRKPKAKKRAPKRRARPTVPEEATFTSAPEGPATSYSETRFFPHGAAWLGYIEGRPGVLGVSAAFPSRGGEPVRELSRAAKSARREAREEAAERLSKSEPGQAAKDEGGAAFTSWLDDMLTVWDFCEDGGALVETECDGDSGKSE